MGVYRWLFFPQKLRFKKIAEVAATRVERMRDLLIRSELISVDPDPLEKIPIYLTSPYRARLLRPTSIELLLLSSHSRDMSFLS